MYVIEDTEGHLSAHEHVVAVEDVEFRIGVGVGSTVAHCHLGDLCSVLLAGVLNNKHVASGSGQGHGVAELGRVRVPGGGVHLDHVGVGPTGAGHAAGGAGRSAPVHQKVLCEAVQIGMGEDDTIASVRFVGGNASVRDAEFEDLWFVELGWEEDEVIDQESWVSFDDDGPCSSVEYEWCWNSDHGRFVVGVEVHLETLFNTLFSHGEGGDRDIGGDGHLAAVAVHQTVQPAVVHLDLYSDRRLYKGELSVSSHAVSWEFSLIETESNDGVIRGDSIFQLVLLLVQIGEVVAMSRSITFSSGNVVTALALSSVLVTDL